MIVAKTFNFHSSRYAPDPRENVRQIDQDLTTTFNCLQGRVRLGSGTSGSDGENISGQWLQITTNAIANTETTFTHTCGCIPVGYWVVWQDKAGSIYQGPATGTAWTTTTISLKCSVASVTALLFLLK